MLLRRWGTRGAFAVIVLCLTASPQARASRDVVARGSGATLHQGPSESSPIVGSVRAGQWLRVADQPKDGWYHCLVPGTKPAKAAWVRSDAVEFRVVPQARASRVGTAASGGSSVTPSWNVG